MKDGFIKVRCFSPEICVGDVSENEKKIRECIEDSAKKGVKILVLPELCLTAYTCADLFSQKILIKTAEKAIDDLKLSTLGKDILVFVGAPLANGDKLYNCAVALFDGEILGVIPKTHLPNYSEFYELRNFTEPNGTETKITIQGKEYPFGNDILFRCKTVPHLIVGCEICEDLWVPSTPSEALCKMGATVICNLSASDEILSKDEYRRSLCSGKSASLMCAYLYTDAPESESTTDVIFSAHNIIAENGTILAESKPFEHKNGDIITEIDVDKLANQRIRANTFDTETEKQARFIDFSLNVTETELTRKIDKAPFVPSDITVRQSRCEQILTMQSHALAKRLTVTRSKCAVIGISGGLDSTLALLATTRAADYIGWERKNIVAITMPCFGTTKRTRSNAEKLCEALGVTFKEVNISDAVELHFKDIGHDGSVQNVTFENAQARERTQVLMDIANDLGGLVVGTGDLSEIALGWSTYNADHMSMYNVNCSVPKTLVRYVVGYFADKEGGEIKTILDDVLNTPVSPELLPPKDGDIAQRTEELVGPYELHDFFLYNMLRLSFTPSKIYRLAKLAFKGSFDEQTIYKWLEVFIKRFFAQQFKRSCSPDGVKIGSVALSPRGDLKMPSDASAAAWLDDLKSALE